MLTRPSEAVTATVGTVVGALLIVVGYVTKVEVPGPVSGAVVILVSYTAWGVTAVIAKRQRKGTLTSGPDGAVR